MEIAGEHQFRAPRQLVWELLLDPQALKEAMPGCEKLETVGPETYDVTLRVGIAAIKGTYTGQVRIEDRKELESYRLIAHGGGKPGRVDGDATLSLEETPDGGTRVRYKGDVRAQGVIARAGTRVLGGAAKLMIGQFFKGMEKQVEARV